MKLIDKDAVVAEIESMKNRAQILGDNAINGSMQQFYDGMKQGCVETLSFLDTFEVKKVDLDMEINLWVRNLHRIPNFEELNKFARHFFEFGLKAQKGE
jgi:hypothetical protein